ncbi:hypothetical protein F4678DRAFT_453523 [Xylaria arbuscula]|nr:hypothetical protein F4678DRAFT_453523 [Xylaria arbuscula]
MASPSPFHSTSVIASTPMASLYPSGFGIPSDGLPVTSQLSTMAGDSYGVFPQQVPQPTPHHTASEAANNAPHAQYLNKKQLRRQRELKDALYPLKLIRQLDRITNDEWPVGVDGTRIFEVVHIDSSRDSGLTVENVSTYSTVQAANERALDFWDREYGAGMFTRASPHPDLDAVSIKKFEHIEDSGRQANSISIPKKHYRSAGGVPANRSSWAVKNKCLSLSHKGRKGENKVYVAVSQLRDHGIHA